MTGVSAQAVAEVKPDLYAAPEHSAVQAIFCELHALLTPEPHASEIRELVAAGVSPARVLSLYPFSPRALASTLQAHLRATGGYDRFMHAGARLGGSVDRALRNQLTDSQRLLRNNDWFTFYEEWTHAKSYHSDWIEQSGDRLTLNEAAEIMWLGAHWPELAELHRKSPEVTWALSGLRTALTPFDVSKG